MTDDTTPAEQQAAPVVQNAETVNVNQSDGHMPYARVITAVTFVILIAFAAVTYWVLEDGGGVADKGVDAATKGSVIQTWNNLAIAAATFWVGPSLAGKMKAK